MPSVDRTIRRAGRAVLRRRRLQRRRRTVALFASAGLVLLVVLGMGARLFLDGDAGTGQDPSAAPPPVEEPEPAPDQGEEPESGADAEEEAEQDEAPDVQPIDIPPTGPGTFRTAPATGHQVGEGTVRRYMVQIEDGIDLDPVATAQEIETILGDPRGWTTDGVSAFQLAEEGTVDFTVKVATPGTVDDICGEYGLDTGGEVNCQVGRTVVVNLLRWMEGSPQFPGPVTEYRALIINHEVGHRLGHGHEGCPEEGALAPAMMQQIKGLDGCEANAWPYDEDGTYISGPWVP
jgi:hypothetical protein